MEKEKLKEECIKLFLSGKSYTEIAKLTNYSRQHVSNLIKNDKRIKEKLNNKTVKVYKLKNRSRMNIPINAEFLRKIGVSKNCEKEDFVEVHLDEKNKIITIKKL